MRYNKTLTYYIRLYQTFYKKPLNNCQKHHLYMADLMDKTINSILTALIAVVLIASAFLPTVIDQIATLTTKYGDKVTGYTTLLSVVIIMTIIGIIIGVIKTYTKDKEE